MCSDQKGVSAVCNPNLRSWSKDDYGDGVIKSLEDAMMKHKLSEADYKRWKESQAKK